MRVRSALLAAAVAATVLATLAPTASAGPFTCAIGPDNRTLVLGCYAVVAANYGSDRTTCVLTTPPISMTSCADLPPTSTSPIVGAVNCYVNEKPIGSWTDCV